MQESNMSVINKSIAAIGSEVLNIIDLSRIENINDYNERKDKLFVYDIDEYFY